MSWGRQYSDKQRWSVPWFWSCQEVFHPQNEWSLILVFNAILAFPGLLWQTLFLSLGLSSWRSVNNCHFASVATSLSFMDSCNFELENVCGMIQSSDDQADWQWVSQVPRGPESDHSSMGQCKGNTREILRDFTFGRPSISFAMKDWDFISDFYQNC